ncbi:hypothetical protein BJV82DRAFT_675668 [Fennellomyces sp. T-0311]|nr:hypothetical protein BJV82DRAFT_675668 [Fennellomyces sp. T-0311]
METTTVSNASVIALESLGKIYVFCYEQLRQVNVPVPPPEYIQRVLSNMLASAFGYAPPALQQFFQTLSQLPIQANIVPVLLALIVFYVVFSVVSALVRSVVRVVYGFIRFSLIVAMVGLVLAFIQQYYEFPMLQNAFGQWIQHQDQPGFQHTDQQQYVYHP